MNKQVLFLLLAGLSIWSCQSKERLEEWKPILKEISTPSGPQSVTPFLSTSNGLMHMSWIENHGDSAALYYTQYSKNKFSKKQNIASGDNWFVNWADFPGVVQNKAGTLLAHFLQKSDTATFAYDIMLVNKLNSNSAWSKPYKLHSDTTKTEHGFASALPLDSGFFISWLDGRNTASETNSHAHGHHGSMSLRGAFLNHEGKVMQEEALDDKVCDCCQTNAYKSKGGVSVVYRNRANNEIRDIYTKRYLNGNWQNEKVLFKDQWQIHGCPVNGPKSVYSDQNFIAVAWFTRIKGTPMTKLTWSEDGGTSFSTPIVIDSVHTLGRVDLVKTKHALFVSWLSKKGDGVLMLSKYSLTNASLEHVAIATTGSKRKVGFPQLESFEDKLYLSWTQADSISSIKMVEIR